MLSPRIEVLASTLTIETKRTEPEFVSLAETLQGLYGCAIELSRTFDRKLRAAEETLNNSRLTGTNGLVVGAMAKLNGSLVNTDQRLTALLGMGNNLQQLQRQGRTIEKLGRSLRSSCNSFAIESARTASCQETFGSFVDELRELAAKIGSLGDVLSEKAAKSEVEQKSLVSDLARGLAELRVLAVKSETAVEIASSRIQGILDTTQLALGHAAEHARSIEKYSSDAVYHLQFGDIIRQKLEHVTGALASAASSRPTSQQLAVQAGQLELILVEIETARGSLASAFSGLAKETELLVKAVGGLAGDARDNSDFKNLKDDVVNLQSIICKGQQLQENAEDTAYKATNTATDLASQLDHVEEVNRVMHLQALNAIVKTSWLGDQGHTLGILSAHVHELSQESSRTVSEILPILENIRGASSANENASERTDVSIEAAVTRIGTLYESFASASSETEALAKRQVGLLAEAEKRLKVLPVLASTLAQLLADLNKIQLDASNLPPDPTNISAAAPDTSPDTYTMESEREVYRRVTGDSPGQFGSASAPVTAATNKEDDNVELF